MLSYSKGPDNPPLLGETIGDNLRRMVERFGERDALVVRHQGYRATYRELWDEVDIAARALLANGVAKGDRVGIWSPNRYEWVVMQFATARSAPSWSTSTPPTRRPSSSMRCNKAGVSVLVMARASAARLRRHAREVRGSCRRCARCSCSTTTGTRSWPSGARMRRASSGRARGGAAPRRRRSTSSTPRAPPASPRAPRSRTTTSSTTATSSARRFATPSATASCIPVPFYHCFGMVMGNLACPRTARAWSCPARRSIRTTRWRPSRRSAAPRCTACRPCSSPCWSTRARASSISRSLRTGIMAGSPCPVEVMKQVRARLHMPEVTICYGMTETSPVSTQTARRRSARQARRARWAASTRTSRSRSSTRDRRGRAARHARRAVHARLQRDARLLGRPGRHRPRHRRRRLDAHRRPGRHGRGRLRARSSGASRT